MDARSPRPVGNRPAGRLDMDDEAGQLFITTLGEMNFIPNPLGGVFTGEMRLLIIRRAEEHPRRRDAVRFCPPAELLGGGVVLLHPDALERADRGHLAQPARCIGRIDRRQYCGPILAPSWPHLGPWCGRKWPGPLCSRATARQRPTGHSDLPTLADSGPAATRGR